jgi:hypothetical protein
MRASPAGMCAPVLDCACSGARFANVANQRKHVLPMARYRVVCMMLHARQQDEEDVAPLGWVQGGLLAGGELKEAVLNELCLCESQQVTCPSAL